MSIYLKELEEGHIKYYRKEKLKKIENEENEVVEN